MPAVAGGTQQSTQQTTDEFDPLEVAAARDDQYVNPLSLFVEATQALNWQREMLRDTVLKQGTYMMTGQADQPLYEEAQKRVYQQLSWLTYTRTFYAAKALMSYDRWNRGVGFKLNVKSKIPYQPKKYLMTISTERRGQPVEWMMDLQGTDKFPEDLEDERGVKLLLKHIQERVKQFAVLKRIRSIRESNGDYMVFAVPKPPVEEMTDYTVERSENAVALLEAIIGNGQAGNIENTIHTQRLGLGFVPLKGEIHPPDNDADVTYNPDRRFKYTKSVQTEGSGNISVQVTKNFSARRQWGTFFNMENHKTIDFINNMMPRIGSAWFEIILQQGEKDRLHLKLTPWGEPKTTFVQPFRISVKDSPMSLPYATTDVIAGKSFDFRVQDMENIIVQRLPPYLISGKGNEIDGMVHSIMAFDEKMREKAREVCTHILETELQKTDDQDKTSNIIERMRAYYSTDSNGPSGSLCPFGERSIFFFNVQGEIAGVEMSSPSIRVVNQFIPQNVPRLVPRKRDASSESRGDDQEERGGGRRNRFDQAGRSRSMTRAQNVMPPPPPAGYVHHVPDAIMEEMKQTRDMVHKLVEAMHAGQAPQQGQGQNMEEMMKVFQAKFDDMEKKMQRQKEQDERDGGEERIATYNESRDEMIILDDIKGWEVCVTNEAPDKCPTKIKVSGIPQYPQQLTHEDDELDLVKEQSPYEFVLDQNYATRDGMPIYVHNSKGGTVMWMFPNPFDKPGEFKNPYEWIIWYVTADEKGSGTETTNSVLIKMLDRNVLMKNGRKEVKWQVSHDLQKKLNTHKWNLDVRIQIDEGSDSVTRAARWLQTVKTSRALVKRVPDTNNYTLDNLNIENKINIKKLVEGNAGDKYNAQMFTSFGIVPANDIAGVLPTWIDFMISDSLVLVRYADNEMMRKNIDMRARFNLVDTREPIYQAQYVKGDTTYRLQIRPFFNSIKEGYVWGLKSDGGEEQDLKWVGSIKYEKTRFDAKSNKWVRTGLYPQELITVDQQDRWHMEFCWDTMMRISQIESIEIEIDYDHQNNNKRTPNIPNITRSQRQEEERYGVFTALKSDALSRMFESTSKQKIETVAKCYENALALGHVCMFGLYLFHRKYINVINNRIGHCRRFQHDSVPKHIIMNHTYLQGEGAVKKGNTFSEESYNLYLVDLQGPVWVSVDGEFMICPFANEVAKYKTWALWRWDVHKAAYMLFAEKSHVGDANHKHLINDRDFDARNNIASKWNFRGRWDGGRVTTNNAFDDLRIYIVHDMKPDVRQAPRADGKKITPNLYHLFQRMPDYTIATSDVEFFKSTFKVDVVAIEARKKRREERERQERQAEGLDCAFVDEEIGHGVDGEFTSGTELGMLVHGAKKFEGQSAASAGRGVTQATDTKQKAEKSQRDAAIKQKEAEDAAITAANKDQMAPQEGDFISITDAIEQFNDTRRTYEARDKADKEKSERVESAVAKTDEQRERKRINTIKRNIRQYVPYHITTELVDVAEQSYISNADFMKQFTTEIIEVKKLNEVENNLTTIARAVAQKRVVDYRTGSAEDDKVIDGFLGQLIDKCVLEIMIRIVVMINKNVKQAIERRIRYEKAQARQKKKAEREARRATNGTENDVDKMKIWQADQNGGVRQVDDLLREDDTPQARHGGHDKGASSSDEDEDEDDFTKTDKITLVELLIAEVTPWTEIMQLYRKYLTMEKDINNEKAQRYREKMDKINTYQRMLKEERELQEHEEEVKRETERARLLEEKRKFEEDARQRYARETVSEGSQRENTLDQCRVFQGTRTDTVPINFKVKIMKDANGDELVCTFTLENPYSLRYVCDTYNLKLEPGELVTEKTGGRIEYGWKLFVYGSDSSQSIMLATKWKMPGVLMPSQQETDAWRWRLSSITKLINMIAKKKTTPKEKNEYLAEISAQRTKVWYRGINFDPAMKDLEKGLLPIFVLKCKPFRDERTRLYPQRDDQVTNVIENMAITVWNQPVLRNNLMKMFEVPTAIFMYMRVNKYMKYLTFVMDENDNQISWTCNDLTSMILTLQPLDNERSEVNSWIILGKTKQTQSEIKDIMVHFFTKKTKSLLDTDQVWTPIPVGTSAQNDKLEQFYRNSMNALNPSSDLTINIIIVDTNPDKTRCVVPLPNGSKIACVSELRRMDIAKQFLKLSFDAADDLHYIRSEANEFDPTAHANFAKLMSKMLTGIMAAGADPTAEISEECEGGLASPRTGARRALGSRAGPPAAVQLLPLQSRKQALQERKRLSVTAPPPRSLPVLSRRLHGH